MTKKDCAGCSENFYNGQNPYGIAECWSFKSAQLIMRKAVPVDQRPPWTQRPALRAVAPITRYTPPPPDCRCVCGLTYADWQASRALWRRLLRWWRS